MNYTSMFVCIFTLTLTLLMLACGDGISSLDSDTPDPPMLENVQVKSVSKKGQLKSELTNPPPPIETVSPIPIPVSLPISVSTSTHVRTASERPIDVGTSHFGALGNNIEGYSGGWIRPHPGPFVWGSIQSSDGGYNWAKTDRWVRQWQQKRLAVLVTIWPFAEWDQNKCHIGHAKAVNPPDFLSRMTGIGQQLYAPCDDESYQAWLGAAVERYDHDGIDDMPGLQYPLRYWEILNEPAMQGPELTFFQEDSAAYLEILKLSYTTIKGADPNAVVLPGGQAGMQPQFMAFWRPVLEGGKNFFDVGNIHSIGSDNEFFASEYRAFLDEYGSADKPFWITEAGIPDHARRGESPITADDLAKMVFTSFASAFGEGADVIIKIHRGAAVGTTAYETYLLLARSIGDFRDAIRITENAVRFEMDNGRTAYVLWGNTQLPSEVTGTVTVITYAGEESQQDASSVVGQVPILVIVD